MNPASAIGAMVLALQPGGPATTAVRGITGAVTLVADGPAIRAKANQSLTAPIVVRMGAAEKQADGRTTYRVEFIGMVAGEYDLCGYLERQDGSGLDLPPLTVRVLSQLEPGHGTDLFSSADSPMLRPTLYRAGAIVLGAAWAGVPVVYFAVRAARRRAEPAPVPPPPAPTLADQLRPLVSAAIDGTLGIAARGRLELLLYLYWRQRLGLDGRQAEVVPLLRAHPEAGALLRAVERWLHARRDAGERPEEEAAALLEAYRHAPAITTSMGAEAST